MLRPNRWQSVTTLTILVFLGVLVAAGIPDVSPTPIQVVAPLSAAEQRLDRIEHMVDSSVKVLYGHTHGSGVLFVRSETVYVLTAAHVVEDRKPMLRPWTYIPDEEAPEIKRSYGNRTIFIQRHRQDETTFKDHMYIAKLLVVDGPTDAAILEIMNARPKHFPSLNGGAVFDLRNNKSLRRGTKTIHVGNFMDNIEAVTEGVIANPQQPMEDGDPPLPDFRVLLTTNMVAPGSSGGGIYLESNGKLIGIVVRTTKIPGEAYSIPIYKIDQWLNSVSEEMGVLLE